MIYFDNFLAFNNYLALYPKEKEVVLFPEKFYPVGKHVKQSQNCEKKTPSVYQKHSNYAINLFMIFKILSIQMSISASFQTPKTEG